MITKNHSFSDGNKRIAATMFLYFLDKNEVLMKDDKKLLDDYTLVALTIMIAESRPEEKEIEEYEAGAEQRQLELDEKIEKYIDSLSKKELQQALTELLYDSPEWIFDRFVRYRVEE